MNGDKYKYKELIEQIKSARTIKEKVETLATMVFMMATNDLHCLEKRQLDLESRIKKLYKILIAIVVLLIISNPDIRDMASKLLMLLF